MAFLPGSEGTVALGDTVVAFVLGFGDITAVSPLDLGTLQRLGTPWWPSLMGLSALWHLGTPWWPSSLGLRALGDTMVAFLLGFGDITAVSPLELGTLRLGTPWWPSFMGLRAL